ncbi:hypothetical protein ES703_54628 [subsurface metagenome]
MVTKLVTRNQLIGVVLVAVVVTAVVTVAAVFFALRVRGRGRIVTVGLEAYADPGATQLVSWIDWGDISPGGTAVATLYLKSTSSVPVTLSLVLENWIPSAAQDFLTVEWDYDGSALQPGEVRAVVFPLRVSGSISGISNFEFDLVITAAG